MHPAGPYIIAGFLILSGVIAVLFDKIQDAIKWMIHYFKKR